jgi:hypothetical protein
MVSMARRLSCSATETKVRSLYDERRVSILPVPLARPSLLRLRLDVRIRPAVGTA